MRIARVNVYLPDDLARRAREAQLNLSRVTQEALRRELAREGTERWVQRLHALPRHDIAHERVLEALDAAREELGGGR